MNIHEIRAKIEENRAAIAAMPEDGAILFNPASRLAIAIPDGDAARGYITGIYHAHVFSQDDRMQPPAGVPGLDRVYRDGSGDRFILYARNVAKKMVLEEMDRTLATVEAALI